MSHHSTFHWRRTLLLKLVCAWLVLILPMCFLSLYSNTHEQTVIRNTIIEQQRTNAAFYLDTLEVEVKRFQTITYAYSQDFDFIRVATLKQWDSNYNRVKTILSIRDKLALVRQMSAYIENLYVMFPRLSYTVNGQNSNDQYDPALADRLLSRPTLGNVVVAYDGGLYVRSFQPTSALPPTYPNILIAIQLSPDRIRDNLLNASGDGRASLLGADWVVSSGTPAPEAELEETRRMIDGQNSATGAYQDRENLYVWQTSELLGATLVLTLPQKAVLQGLWDAERLLYLLLAVQGLCMVLAVYMLYASVHKPIRRMTRAFEAIEQGDQNVRLSTDHQDEFQYLYAGFNHMMDQQKALTAQMVEQKLLSQQSQLKQLQMQINPHFFYNSFFAVRAMIDMGDTDTAVYMLECLGQYFRFITRSGRETIPLSQEVMHARAYCDIQQIRFENIAVDFAPLPAMLADVTVPRLILQPLIENAYVHGLENVSRPCRLSIRFDQTDAEIFIVVENDGMDDVERCAEGIRQKLEQGCTETTAILNIHRRLRLYYGPGAGVHVSVGEIGLKVTLVLLKGEMTDDQRPVCG